jgi:hypothetical protein
MRSAIPSPHRRAAQRVAAASAACLIAVAGAAPSDGAIVRRRVVAKRGIGEFQPAHDSGWLAWEENSRADLDHYDVYARREGGARFKVNESGQAAVGGIDGDLLVYQGWRGKSSNIRFMDLSTRRRFSPQVFVNTRLWEYWPSISGDWLLFGRRNARRTRRKVILFNRATLTHRVLDVTSSGSAFLAPGQVNGNWAVWHRCKPPTRCNVYRYNIRLRIAKRIPNPTGRSQYAASVTPEGTVFFARGSRMCGRAVSLMRYTPGQRLRRLARLRPGRDLGDTYVSIGPSGAPAIFFERNTCRRLREARTST